MLHVPSKRPPTFDSREHGHAEADNLRRSVQACAAMSGVLALLGLLNWSLHDWRFLAFGEEFVPTAPSTAWSAILLSCGTLWYGARPSKTSARVAAYLAVAGVTAMGVLVCAAWLVGVKTPVEEWLADTTDRVGNIPVGRMSPLTATAFIVTALAFLCELPPLGGRWWRRQLAASLALASASLCFVVLLSYALDAPLLYGTDTIPMALWTALLVAPLALGLLASAGTDTFPLSLFGDAPSVPSNGSKRWGFVEPLAAFVFLSVGIGAVGLSYFNHQSTVFRSVVQAELSAVADLKVRQIEAWRADRLHDAKLIASGLFTGEQIVDFLYNPGDDRLRAHVLDWLDSVRFHNQGLRAVLLDREMNVRLASPDGKGYFGPVAKAQAKKSLSSGSPSLSDLYAGRFSGEIHMDLAIPIMASPEAVSEIDAAADGSTDLRQIAVVVIEIDPGRFLYPLIADWPTPSRTAESLLVRRDGNTVLFVNELRHSKGAALSLRLPVSTQSLPAAEAVLRCDGGFIEGIDYRGVPVLAAVRDIENCPWFLVAKVDQEEAFAPLHKRSLATGGVVLALILLAALGVWLIGRRRDARWLRNQLAIEREHRLILDSIDQGVLGLDRQGRHVFANPAACRMLGYTPDELIGKACHPLWHARRVDGSPSPLDECRLHRMLETGEPWHSEEEILWRKDGTSFAAECSATSTPDRDRPVARVILFFDITERRRAEENLRDSEARYRTLFESTRDAVMTLAPPSWNFASGNPATIEMFGLRDVEQFTSLSPSDLSPAKQPDGRLSKEKASQMIETAMRQGSHFFEWTHKRFDGEEFPCTVLLTRVELGGEVFLQSTLRDITAEKRVEASLLASKHAAEASQAQYEQVVSMISDIVWRYEVDEQGHFVGSYISPAVDRLLGVPAGTIGDSFENFFAHVHPDDLRRTEDTFFSALSSSAQAKHCEYRLVKPDGSTLWAHSRGSAHLQPDGHVVAYGTTSDITERKHVEEERLQSLERMEKINRLQEELILPGAIDDKFRKITDAATEILDLDFCRIWVVGPADLCEQGCIHADVTNRQIGCRDRQSCLHLISSSGRYTHVDGDHRRVPLGDYKIGRIATGQERAHLTNQVTTDPEVHNHQWAEQLGLVSFAGYKLHNAAGRPAGVLAAFAKHPLADEHDAILSNLAETTSKTIIDNEVKRELCGARNRAEAATMAKSFFLANMSHEIRTPMTAILGFTDILLKDLKDPDAMEAAQIVKRNGEHLLQLINDILDISKIEAGKVELDVLQWSPRQIVAEVVSLMHVRASAKGLTLTDEYIGPLPETIATDPARLRQILVNLVGNAIKFTETGGVRIVTRLVDDPDGEPRLRFQVIDTGIGVPQEEVPGLFEPFTQADGSSSRKFEGTGLGLAISRQLALMLGGEIEAESEPGIGSTFTLTISTGPLDNIRLVEYLTERPSASDEVKPAGESQERLRCRILLADDIADNQRLISAVLSEAGADVTIAQDGHEAVEKALAGCLGLNRRHSDPAEPFDVILMDVQMPILDGHAATRRLRHEGYTGPIIALTAHAMRGDREKCIDAGCDDYLTKPIDPKKLRETVSAWISRHKSEVGAIDGRESGRERSLDKN